MNSKEKNTTNLIKCVHDYSYGIRGKWDYVEDKVTKHISISQIPSQKEILSFYDTYYTHKESKQSKLLYRINDYYSNLVLGYPENENVMFLTKLIALLPTLKDSALLDFLYIPYCQNSKTILDFGCGNGTLIKKLKYYGFNVSGVDFDEKAISELKKDGIEVYSSLKLVSKKYDIIIMSHILEHLVDPESDLIEISNLLNIDGMLIIATPNSTSLGKLLFHKYWRGLEAPRHFNIFSNKSFKILADKIGLTVLESRSTTRHARGFFYVSFLSLLGFKNIEIKKQNFIIRMPVKFLSYGFQIIENIVCKFIKFSGEELLIICQKKK
jgi:2-polyprenyl-3-methyl-5-hydroxy-6-metoxy-1,4-benzoquinol methylase